MYQHRLFHAQFLTQLTHAFQERQGFNVTHGAANFDDCHIVAFTTFKDSLLDGVSNMRDHLNRGAKVVAPTLFAQHVWKFGQS